MSLPRCNSKDIYRLGYVCGDVEVRGESVGSVFSLRHVDPGVLNWDRCLPAKAPCWPMSFLRKVTVFPDVFPLKQPGKYTL